MNEQQVQDMLYDLLDEEGMEQDFAVRTFEEEGVLTMNKGLVLRFPDGSEYQLTIVRSR